MIAIANLALALIIFIVLLGIIVFIHELGHFLAAKKAGVVVQEFAFGFGPRLIGKKWHGTDYRINLYPLGGYCKMLGDQDGSSFLRYSAKDYDPQDKKLALELFSKGGIDPYKDDYNKVEDFVLQKKEELPEKEYLKLQTFMLNDYVPNHPGNFDNVSRSKRAVIVSAGVVMNFILGVILYYIFFLVSGFYVDVPKIGNPGFIGAEVANLPFLEGRFSTDNAYANSIVIKANGELVRTPQQFQDILRENYDQPVELELQQISEGGYEFKTANLVLNGEGYSSFFDQDLYLTPVVSKVNENSLAEGLGLKQGDVLLSLQDESLQGEGSVGRLLRQYQGQQVVLKYLTGNAELVSVNFTIPIVEEGQSVLGIGYYLNDPYPPYLLRINYLDNKLFSGISHAVNMSLYNITGLAELVRESFAAGSVQPVASSVTSVVGVSRVVYTLVEVRDFSNIINLAALVSLSLGIMNILPIPLFDGGHLLFLAIEKLRGKKLEPQLQERISAVAFYVLIILSVLIIFKDILSFGFVQQIINAIGSIFAQ